MDEKKHLSPRDLVRRWGVPLNTLSRWRWNGTGPLFMKLGKHIVYRREDVEAFEEQKLRKDTTCTVYEGLSTNEKGGKNDYSKINIFSSFASEGMKNIRKKHL